LILLISVMSRSAGGLATKLGPRWLLTIGPTVAGVGFALFALPNARAGSYWTTFFPPIAVLGLGMGLTVAPLTTTVMSAVDREHAGVASGINNAVSRTAGLLAIATLGVVVVTRFDRALDERLSRIALSPEMLSALARERNKLAGAALPPGLDTTTAARLRLDLDEAFVSGFRAAMLVSAGLAALGALLVFVLIDGKPKGDREHPPHEANHGNEE